MQQTAPAGLYEADFALRVAHQVDVLRQAVLDGRLRDLDVENVIEELEGLAQSERASLQSHYTTLAMHLLKLHYQPSQASRSWLGTIVSCAARMRKIVKNSPSLNHEISDYLREAYQDARLQASAETGLPMEAFPIEPTDAFLTAYIAAFAGVDFGGELIVQKAEAHPPRGSIRVRKGPFPKRQTNRHKARSCHNSFTLRGSVVKLGRYQPEP